jgi:hypothetical protein
MLDDEPPTHCTLDGFNSHDRRSSAILVPTLQQMKSDCRYSCDSLLYSRDIFPFPFLSRNLPQTILQLLQAQADIL